MWSVEQERKLLRRLGNNLIAIPISLHSSYQILMLGKINICNVFLTIGITFIVVKEKPFSFTMWIP
jgi:hypothetical protein